MKIVHTADLHLGLSFINVPESQSFEELRFNDFLGNLERIKDHAINNKADFFIIAGDVFHNPRPSAKSFNEFSRIIGDLVRNDIDVIIVLGNHDSPKTRESLSYLKSYVNVGLERYHLFDISDSKVIERNGERIRFIGLPYPHFQPPSYTDFISHFENRLEKLKEMHKNVDYTIVVGHLYIEGAEFGSERILTSFRDHPIPRRFFEVEDIDLVCLGHMHKPQQLGEKIFYSGSIERIDFGEEGETKSFLEIELNGKIRAKRMPLQMREMKTLSLDLSKEGLDENFITSKISDVKEGSLIKLKIKTPQLQSRINIAKIERSIKEKLKLAHLKIEILKEEMKDFKLEYKSSNFLNVLEEYLRKQYKNEPSEFLELVKKEALKVIEEVDSA